MAKKEKTKYWELLVAAVLTVIVPQILRKVWPPFDRTTSWLWEKLTARYLVQGWVLLIFFGLALLFLIGVVVLLWMNRGSAEEDADEEGDYTSDEIFGVRWEWAWSFGEVVAIEGICPECSCTLTDSQSSMYTSPPVIHFFCQHCNEFKTSVPGVYLSNAHSVISKEIIRRLRLKKQAKLASH